MSWEVLDPRHDREPPYWRGLRARAALRADWAWDVLAAQAWTARTPLFVAVLRNGPAADGVVFANWAGLPVRRNGFVGAGRARLLGGLHVRNPGSGSVPGWWSDGLPTGEFLRDYMSAMRRALGIGCGGALLRQLTADEVTAMGRCVSRPTESLAILRVSAWSSVADWMAGMKRKRRQNMRQIVRAVEQDGTLTAEVVPGAELDPLEVARVLRHNEQKYAGRLAPLQQTTGYLTALLRQPDVVVGAYRAEGTGELEAFVTVLDHPRWPVTRHWSARPATRPDRPNLYLDHYRLMVEYAHRTGKEGVIVGRGKPELKSSLRGELVPQYAAAIR
ncbi:GNAT family N-acetyltransferase [Actinophytocola glycyrrhizae]|uniref:GNAT family N-acetyltransferase n=1 Tax=Actinophytocola glycyrrhizae TaxID=2044873 RepID=A0ABV9RT86_9PSEU